MRLLRLILNNGFFILVLATAAILTLAYSTRDRSAETKVAPVTVIAIDASDKKTSEQNNTSTTERLEAQKYEPESKMEKDSDKPDKQEEKTEGHTNVTSLDDKKVVEKETLAITEHDDPKDNSASTPTLKTENNNPQPMEAKTKTLTNQQAIESALNRYSSFQQAWQAARQAFFKSDFQQAERIYDALAIISQNPDILGEYGNLMWRLKQTEKAEQLWQASAARWIDTHQPQRAAYLADRLQTFSPKTSESIRKRLNERQENNVSSMLPNTPVRFTPPRFGFGNQTN